MVCQFAYDRMGHKMSLIEQLKTEAPFITWKAGIKLSEISHMKIGGKIAVFGQVKTTKKLIAAVKYCTENNLKYAVVGGLSNLIGADEGYDGVLIQDLTQELKVETQNQAEGAETIIWASSGWRMSALVAELNKRGLGGLEEMLSLPGTLGGAIYNNAHFQDKLLSDYLVSIDYYDPQQDELQNISAENAEFAYEHSIFQEKKWLIWGATLKLRPTDPQLAQERAIATAKWRLEKQPLECPSSGCIFQNVPNNSRLQELFPEFKDKALVSVGFLIDRAGLKGKRIGGLEISAKHAAFIINPKRKGTRADLDALVKLIKETLKEKYGVELQEEVFYLE